jgi:hypothetical protein
VPSRRAQESASFDHESFAGRHQPVCTSLINNQPDVANLGLPYLRYHNDVFCPVCVHELTGARLDKCPRELLLSPKPSRAPENGAKNRAFRARQLGGDTESSK